MTQRTIKFRAWDRKKKQFDTCQNGGNHMLFSLDYKGVHSLSKYGYKIYQQFTGLLDKNCKEIYEGDIMQDLPNGYEPRPIFKIIWDESECRFEAMFRDSLNGNWELKRHIVDIQHMKIIGNIFEHPNLLP